MRIDIISAVPELLSGPFDSSIIKKSIEKKITEVHIQNLRDYSSNNYNFVCCIYGESSEKNFDKLSEKTYGK